jgi:hypothetical protein
VGRRLSEASTLLHSVPTDIVILFYIYTDIAICSCQFECNPTNIPRHLLYVSASPVSGRSDSRFAFVIDF